MDYLVVGTDSGRLMIWQYENNAFTIVRAEAFGKSGARRIVPGEYVAVDPYSRAIMVAAVEKQKFVYELHRNSSETQSLVVSSPLNAHSEKTLVFDICAVDTAEENPIFATLEVDYSASDETISSTENGLAEKYLVFYEVDQGSHSVIKREKKPVPATSNKLIPVCGGNKGPGGILVCSENLITYRNLEDEEEVQIPIPRRQDSPYARGLLITAFTTQYQSDYPFILLQSEYGDLYFVTVEKGARRSPVSVLIRYFDTVPRATSLCIFKKFGMIFIATEFGDHRFYHIKSLGDESDQHLNGEVTVTVSGIDHKIPVFYPHSLKNLVERTSSRIKNTAPILDVEIQDLLDEGVPQYYCVTGRSSQASLRILRHGILMSKIGKRNLSDELPTAIFTMKAHRDNDQHKYILISFDNHTFILGLNGKEITTAENTNLDDKVCTLDCGLIGVETLCQVHSRGINFVTKGINRPWDPSPKKISRVAMNQNQIVVALSGGQIAYLEYDPQTGLVEDRMTKDMGQDVACLCIEPISKGNIRSNYLGVGYYNRSAQILNLDPSHMWDEIATLTLTAEPTSMKITEMYSGDKTVMHFNIGLDNGVLQRTQMSKIDGKLQKDLRIRVLGTKPVKLLDLEINGKPGLIAISSRSWLHYTYNDTFTILPVNIDSGNKGSITHISNLNCDIVSNGFCIISQGDLIISKLENLGETFSQSEIPLKYTPRSILTHPQSKKLIILETDHNSLRETEKAHSEQVEGADDMQIDSGSGESDSNIQKNILSERDYGAPMTAPNSAKWASYVRIVDLNTLQTIQYMEVPEGECALSMAICTFHQKPGETYLLLGTAKNLSLIPRKCEEGYIRTYRFTSKDALELIHKTQVEDIPTAFHSFQGNVLVGIKNLLRLYSFGQKKLLKISENRKLPNSICGIESEGNRIFVSDVSESFFYLKYNSTSQQLHVFADNTIPRMLTSSVQLDYDTLAGGDKFGNFFVTRVPKDVVEDVEDLNRGGTSWMWQRGLLNGAPQKAQEIVQFHLGDIITNMKKLKLVPGTPGVIVYTTILGSIGIFMPIVNRSDVEFFSLLEMHLRKECPPLSGRDHLEYRSSFHPCRNTIDGDLLESFISLPQSKQEEIAQDLGTDVLEISKKIEMLRAQSGF